MTFLRIGAHVSIAGGLCRSIERARRIEADCIQLFASSPRSWAPSHYSAEEIACFLDAREKAGVDPIFLHSIYLINLASPSEALRARSIDSLVSYLNVGRQLGAAGVVTHIGSGGEQATEAAEALAVAALREVVLRGGDQVPPLLVETSAGSGNIVGSSFAQMGRIIRAVAEAGKIGLCLDTAHVFAAGYDIGKPDSLERTIDELDREIGVERLKLVHANDSKTRLGSHVDRHENIGRGFLGEDTFRSLLHHPALRETPFIIEVPGFDREGPDAENIALLRKLGRD